MKKFQFAMETILSYKGQILDSEMMNLAVLRDLLGNVQKRLEGLEQERLKTKQEFETKVSIEVTSADWQAYASYEKHIKEQKKICAKEIAELEEQISLQLERIKKLKIETKSLETIKESKFEEYKKEDLKRTEQFVDEFISGSRVMSKVFRESI